MSLNSVLATALILLLAMAGRAQDRAESAPVAESDRPFLLHYPNLENPFGEVLLRNEHVVLQRLVVPAGEWEGVHSHPGNQIYVHIKGGEWTGRLGGRIEYSAIMSPDGEVGWMDAIPLSAGHDSGNTGDTDIDLVYVTLKGDGPIAPGIEHSPQVYPDIPLQPELENERMIVQRLRLDPGQWTGPHAHPGNQVYVHVRGGTWAERRGGESRPLSFRETGSVGWLDASKPGESHDVGNAGESTIELVLVTLK